MKLIYTIDDWQGYRSVVGAGLAVYRLNKKLTTKIETALDQISKNELLDVIKIAKIIRDEMYIEMSKESKYGLNDTEPQCVVLSFIEKGLNLKYNSLSRWE